jgi:4-amino-4-deoxy-L-arabinose transferase-like glycosyltransferase
VIERPVLAWRPVGAVALGVTALLLATAGGYDYHRDELYFRMLGQHPAWGYVDEPPFTPLLVRLSTEVFGDTLRGLRVPAAVVIGVVAVLAALVAREASGGAVAQTLAALGAATPFPLIGGHVTSTAGPDLVVWLLVILFAMRALLRDRPRYWLGAGLVSGLGLYNKHLVVLLLLMLVAGLLLVGPRRALLSGWLWAGAALALVVGLPNLVYQATHGFPQLEMAAALAHNKGDDARADMVPLQVLMLGAPMVPIWVAGSVTLFRDARLRPVRALAVAYPLMIVVLLVIAGQPYYTMGLLLALYAIGCAPTERWLAGRRGRQVLVGAGFLVNVAVGVVVALPVVPADRLAGTPIGEINQVTRDQVGWQAYVRQVADVSAGLPADERARAVVVTGNYGEAGAVDRYGPRYGLPKVYSGQNELYHLGHPPDSATVAIVVWQGGPQFLAQQFESCTDAGRLDNRVGVHNEEQDEARLYVCRGPRESWSVLWPRFQHFD